MPIIARDSILLTGGAGFIGANLVNKLLDSGYKNIHLLVKKSSNLGRLKNVIRRVNVHNINLLDKDGLKKIAEKIQPSVILHLATYNLYRNQEDVEQMIDVSIRGTLNLLLATKNIPYKIFINTGSSSEYGIKENPMKESDMLEPISFYAAVKASSTFLCQVFAREYDKSIVTLRPFSVYGPLEEETRFIPTIIRSLVQKKPIKLTPGKQRRDFVFIDDVTDIYLKAIENNNKLKGKILNMGTGIEYSNDEVVKALFEVTGKKIPIEKGAFPKRLWDTPHWVADTTYVKKMLKWEPKYSLREGLKKTYEWYKNETF